MLSVKIFSTSEVFLVDNELKSPLSNNTFTMSVDKKIIPNVEGIINIAQYLIDNL